jgi:hypothetical protein
MSKNLTKILKGFFLHQFLQQNISLLNIQALVHQKSGMIRDVAFGGTEILYTHVDEPWTHHFLSEVISNCFYGILSRLLLWYIVYTLCSTYNQAIYEDIKPLTSVLLWYIVYTLCSTYNQAI